MFTSCARSTTLAAAVKAERRRLSRLQNIFILQQDLVGGEEGVELGPFVSRVDPLPGPDDGPTGDISNVSENIHVRTPLAELLLPSVRGSRMAEFGIA